MIGTFGFCLFDNCLTFTKVSAVGEECFAVVRTSVSGTESRWFDSSHQFAGVVQNPRRLLPHKLKSKCRRQDILRFVSHVSLVRTHPWTFIVHVAQLVEQCQSLFVCCLALYSGVEQLVACKFHMLEVAGPNPASATKNAECRRATDTSHRLISGVINWRRPRSVARL